MLTTKIVRSIILSLALLMALVAGAGFVAGSSKAEDSYLFQTGYSVSGRFLQYWREHGALVQQGYPITDMVQEVSPVNGKTYSVQYFERAVFELHPENPPPHDVLLSLLGSMRYKEKYPQGAPGQAANNTSSSILFQTTGKRLGGVFLQYWQQHGGLTQQGYPISDEFQERSDLNGNLYKVQYFERAVFEWHPENAGTPYDVMLVQLVLQRRFVSRLLRR